MKTDAQKQAQKRYITERAVFSMTITKEQKERWKAAAAAKGKSLTAYIAELVEEDIRAGIK